MNLKRLIRLQDMASFLTPRQKQAVGSINRSPDLRSVHREVRAILAMSADIKDAIDTVSDIETEGQQYIEASEEQREQWLRKYSIYIKTAGTRNGNIDGQRNQLVIDMPRQTLYIKPNVYVAIIEKKTRRIFKYSDDVDGFLEAYNRFLSDNHIPVGQVQADIHDLIDDVRVWAPYPI